MKKPVYLKFYEQIHEQVRRDYNAANYWTSKRYTWQDGRTELLWRNLVVHNRYVVSIFRRSIIRQMEAQAFKHD